MSIPNSRVEQNQRILSPQRKVNSAETSCDFEKDQLKNLALTRRPCSVTNATPRDVNAIRIQFTENLVFASSRSLTGRKSQWLPIITGVDPVVRKSPINPKKVVKCHSFVRFPCIDGKLNASRIVDLPRTITCELSICGCDDMTEICEVLEGQ